MEIRMTGTCLMDNKDIEAPLASAFERVGNALELSFRAALLGSYFIR